LIREVTTTYERGVRLAKAAFRPIAKRLIRSTTLPNRAYALNLTKIAFAMDDLF